MITEQDYIYNQLYARLGVVGKVTDIVNSISSLDQTKILQGLYAQVTDIVSLSNHLSKKEIIRYIDIFVLDIFNKRQSVYTCKLESITTGVQLRLCSVSTNQTNVVFVDIDISYNKVCHRQVKALIKTDIKQGVYRGSDYYRIIENIKSRLKTLAVKQKDAKRLLSITPTECMDKRQSLQTGLVYYSVLITRYHTLLTVMTKCYCQINDFDKISPNLVNHNMLTDDEYRIVEHVCNHINKIYYS